jgi:Fic family protein
MKTPGRPPDWEELLEKVFSGGTPVKLTSVPDSMVGGKYLHWDKLRHLNPPQGLDHQSWWWWIKMQRRAQARQIPLRDKSEKGFTYNLVDPLFECLHHIDSLARGIVPQPDPVTNPATRDTYLMRSLIEESITSSQLEGASTTRDVAKRMIREGRPPRDRGERMILNNYQTMRHILELKDQAISKEVVFAIHRMVTDGTLDDPSGAGRFRRAAEKVVVGDDYGEVFHVPPPAEELERRMDAMCDFANGGSPAGFVHPMVRSMILHFWLAYDHPFIDGNGRTARALFYWSMLRNGYWLFEFIAISSILLEAPARYGRAFLETETDDNDLTYFLLFHADVIRRAIDALYAYIDRRTRRLADAQEQLRGLTELNHRQRDLVAHALRHPGEGYTVESHRKSHEVVYQTARTDLLDLAKRGLMKKRKSGRFWVFTPVPDLEERLKSGR